MTECCRACALPYLAIVLGGFPMTNGNHLRIHTAQGEDIGCAASGFRRPHLWCTVYRISPRPTTIRNTIVILSKIFRESEISKIRLIIFDQTVRWLDVLMFDIECVCKSKRIKEAPDSLECSTKRASTADGSWETIAWSQHSIHRLLGFLEKRAPWCT